MEMQASDPVSNASEEGDSSGVDGSCTPVPQLSPAEARNLAFVVSHHLARNQLRLTDDLPEDSATLTELSARVADRLNDLSLRLCSDETRGRLGAAL